MPVGSDLTAASGGERKGSKWQRSAADEATPVARKMLGTATGMLRTPVQKLVSYSTVTNLGSDPSAASGGERKGSEWQRPIESKKSVSPKIFSH